MPTGVFANAHAGTPTLQVSDARGLMVRTVQFHRREADDPTDTRVTEQRYDAVGRLLASRDPYLFDLARTDEATPFNLAQVTGLSGSVLASVSVDAGWRVSLLGGGHVRDCFRKKHLASTGHYATRRNKAPRNQRLRITPPAATSTPPTAANSAPATPAAHGSVPPR